LPKTRDVGWDTVTWGAKAAKGEYIWREGTQTPIGTKASVIVRLFEDFQNNWIHLEKPFVLDIEPEKYALEYDFVRNPPVPGKIYDPPLRKQRVLRCLGFRPPHRSFFHFEMKYIGDIRNHLGAHFLRSEVPQLCIASDILAKGG